MKDKGGRIKIPGFYDDVRPLRDEERAEFKKLPFNETRYRKELGAPKLFGESGYTTLERVWARPTFEVNGLLSGFTGEGAKTVIPAVAMAKVSMRLVPDQDPDKIAQAVRGLRRRRSRRRPSRSKVTRMHGGKPWMTDFDNRFVQAAGRAIEKGFGKAPVFNREGGSIPVVATFQEILGLPSVLFGVGLPGRERARAEREARSRQLPRRHHRVGLSVRRGRQRRGELEPAAVALLLGEAVGWIAALLLTGGQEDRRHSCFRVIRRPADHRRR